MSGRIDAGGSCCSQAFLRSLVFERTGRWQLVNGSRSANLFRFPDRLDRLRRSRWQWFSIVALMLVLRLQDQLPLVLEIMVAVEFAVFLALPVRSHARAK